MIKKNLSLSLFSFVFFVIQSFTVQNPTELNSNNNDIAYIRVAYLFTQRAADDAIPERIDTMYLDIGLNCSKYYDPYVQIKDSLNNLKMTNIKSMSVIKNNNEAISDLINKYNENTIIKSNDGISSIIFKNRMDNNIYTFDKNGTRTSVLLEEKIPVHDWIITEDSLRIMDYSCNKAITKFRGREYEAYFTSEISSNDGPWKLYGLPGLILKAESTDRQFSFKAIGIQNLNNNKISLPFEKNMEIARDLKQYYNFLRSKDKEGYIGFINNGDATLYKTNLNANYEYIELF